MSGVVVTKTYPLPVVNECEVWRYAACREADDGMRALLNDCMSEAAAVIACRVCFARYPAEAAGDVCRFGGVTWRSAALAARLIDVHEAVLFAATLGAGFDRLLQKYSRLSPARALVLQAYGTACVEALCDTFCAEFPDATARFSPGYGDWALAAQRDVFRLLAPSHHIGVCLNDSLLMTPVKSVTAVIGIKESDNQ